MSISYDIFLATGLELQQFADRFKDLLNDESEFIVDSFEGSQDSFGPYVDLTTVQNGVAWVIRIRSNLDYENDRDINYESFDIELHFLENRSQLADQLETTATKLFKVLSDLNRWPMMLVFDMQHVLRRHQTSA